MKAISRRAFLASAAGTVAAAALIPAWSEAGMLDRLFRRPAKLPSPITPNDEFYVTSIGGTPAIDLGQWSFRITGLVKHPLIVTYDDLLKRPQVSLISTLECIGNPVGGESIGTATWEGVNLNALLDDAGVDVKRAVDLVLRGADGYSDSFPVTRAIQEDVLLVTRMNGVPLPPVHGFPARVIVPGIYGMKHVKWLTDLELVDRDYRGYWEQRGWSDEATVKVRSRIDLPAEGETVGGQGITIRGIAFGGVHGIRSVELSTDGGTSFREAQLEPPLSKSSWVFWSYPWKLPSAGRYTLVVRATDRRGVRQSAEPAPAFPDGAGGLHKVTVTVAA
jgi:DMSO/TMAO reductase YedYZ molybdopterin-dependent catalytic subunit